jgi:hypothetical protein
MTKLPYVASVFAVTTLLGSCLAFAQQPAPRNTVQQHPMTSSSRALAWAKAPISVGWPELTRIFMEGIPVLPSESPPPADDPAF